MHYTILNSSCAVHLKFFSVCTVGTIVNMFPEISFSTKDNKIVRINSCHDHCIFYPDFMCQDVCILGDAFSVEC